MASSNSVTDRAISPTLDSFLALFETVARRGFDLLEPGRFAVLVIGDKYTKGESISLGFDCMERMQRVGFRKGLSVKRWVTGSEWAKGGFA